MTKIETSLHALFQTHRVIFWYDAGEKLRAEYEAVALDGIEKAVVGQNEFALKHRILRGAPEGRYLLYFPQGEPPLSENWLLDLQLAHKVFHTDQEAMFLQELGLDYAYKDLVREHSEFFQSMERRAKLKAYLAAGDNEQEVRFKMMAVVFGSDYFTLEAYIQAYAAAFISGDVRLEKELERFRLNEAFWRAVGRKFHYHAAQPRIYDFLLDVFSRNFTPTNQGRSVKETRILLSIWKDALSHQETFRQLSEQIAKDLKVASLLEAEPMENILPDDLFRVIDLKIIHELAARLLRREISLDKLLAALQARKNKYWYPEYRHYYACLEQAGQLLDKVGRAPRQPVAALEEAARQYAAEGFLVDFHYRKCIYHYRQARQDGALSALLDKVLKAYANDWLLPQSNRLQDHLNGLESWIGTAPKAQRRFFANHVRPVASDKARLFVVISDALRYENGWELCRDIQAEKRYEAELDYLIAGLPSYTQLGMAALLPHQELSIQAGKDAVLADGLSTAGTQGRSKVLETRAGLRAVAIQAKDFMKMNSRAEGRPFVMQYDLIYIYHNRIDKTGDDKTTEDRVFEAVEEEIAFLKELLRKIANVNGNNILITADHGYLYQHDALEDSEYAASEVQGEVWKLNRRFVLGKNLAGSNALKKFTAAQLGLSGEVEVLITKGINRLRVKGAGARYVHGGASLQEIVVPLLKVTKLREDTTSQVGIDLIKSTDKITTNILAVSFLQKELVSDKVLPRQIRAFVQAEDGTVLSDIYHYTFDAAEGSERQRETRHRFQLSSLASSRYKNQRVALVLEEPVAGSSKWKEYKSYHYTLNISFTNDFDDF
jgi:uncharacterized protein (TIGR02687 family)